MAYDLHSLQKPAGRVKKRRGRGNASGRGNYSTRGIKGQNARSGGKNAGRHAGKKVPSYIARLPKRAGFTSRRQRLHTINVSRLNVFEDGATVTIADFVKRGLIPSAKGGVKVLGMGRLVKKLNVHAEQFSKAAIHAITEQGGKAHVRQTEAVAKTEDKKRKNQK